VGRTLAELGLAGEGPRVVAVVRGSDVVTTFRPEFRLRTGDTLVLSGTHAEMDRAFERLRG
jgi:uncharacterized protein with PhoU and TrkA domain